MENQAAGNFSPRKPESTTKRETQILYAIKELTQKHGYPPSYREINDAVGLKSMSTVNGYIARLAKKGCLARKPGSPRAIALTKKGHQVIEDINVMPVVDPIEEFGKWKHRRWGNR
jgi:repressor LexA